MKHLSKFIIPLLIITSQMYAQQNTTFISDLVDPTASNFNLIYGDDKIDGDPYLIDEWRRGEVLTANGNKIALDEIKLDVCSYQVVTKIKGKETWLNNRGLIAIILEDEDGNSKSTYIKTVNKDDEIVFAKVVAEGDYSILGFPSKKFKRPVRRDDYSYGSRDVKSASFSNLDFDYYLTYLNDNHEKIKLKEKDLEKKIQKKHQRLFKTYSKKVDMDIKTEGDMRKFLDGFNKEINQKESESEQE